MKHLCKPCGHCLTCTGHKRRREKVKRQNALLHEAAHAIETELKGHASQTDWTFALERLVERIDDEARRR